jgi:drug/metabolite transporter (DMT)-like permease
MRTISGLFFETMSLSIAAIVLLSALLHASWNALLHSGQDRLWTMTIMNLAMAVVAIVAIPLLPLPDRASWPYIVASGFLEVGYNLFLIQAYRYGDLGQAYPIARGSSPVLVTIGAMALAGEILSPFSATGVFLVSGGIIALAFNGRHLNVPSTAMALVTGCFIAAYTVVDGVGVRLSGNSFSYTAWMVMFWALPMPLILLGARGKGAFRAPAREVVRAAGGGIVALLAYGTIIWALKFGEMGPISALRETSVVFAAIIGRLFLSESLTLYRVVACIVIAAGAALLGYGF